MRTFVLLLLTLYFAPIYSVNMGNDSDIFMNRLSVNQEFQGNFSYKYGMRKIDNELYIHNLGTNVQSYVASKNWNEYKREEFRNAYERYMDALKKDRLSADDFGNITDSKGELGNVDGDDYWYDNKGNRISGAEYRALSVRKQKKYRAFYANKEVATYFNEIAKAIVNRRYSHNM